MTGVRLDDPRHDRGDQRHADHDPSAAIGVFQLKAVAGIPEQVPDAVAQVKEGAE